MRTAQILWTAAWLAAILSGQELRFSAASLKPLPPIVLPPAQTAPSGEPIVSERMVRTAAGSAGNPGVVSPGRVHSAATLREFLANAYDVKEFQVVGPEWMDTERFVLDASMPPETTPVQRRSMLQNLLADRFRLAIHRDTRELPVYSLVVTKHGPKLKESPDAGDFTSVRIATTGSSAHFTAERETMRNLADHLTRQLDRPVRDETGLAGKYDFTLTFASTGGSPEVPDVFGALQSQLGLKLESGKGPVERIVVDHIDKVPAEN